MTPQHTPASQQVITRSACCLLSARTQEGAGRLLIDVRFSPRREAALAGLELPGSPPRSTAAACAAFHCAGTSPASAALRNARADSSHAPAVLLPGPRRRAAAPVLRRPLPPSASPARVPFSWSLSPADARGAGRAPAVGRRARDARPRAERRKEPGRGPARRARAAALRPPPPSPPPPRPAASRARTEAPAPRLLLRLLQEAALAGGCARSSRQAEPRASVCVFFKDGRSGGGGGRGSSSWSRRGSRVGGGSGPGLGAPAAPAGVLCVPAAVRREPLHDRVRYLQGLVPRQVNKPPAAPPPPATGRPRRRAGRPRPPPPGRRAAPSAQGPRRRAPGPGSGARGAPGSPGAGRADGGWWDRPAGRRVATTNGNKGGRPRSWQGRPGRGDAAGAGAGGGGRRSAGPVRRPSSRPQPGHRPARSSRPESPAARPPSPAGRRAFLPGGHRLSPARGPQTWPSSASPRGSPSRPLPGSLSNFPGRGALGRGQRQRQPGGLCGVNRATDEASGT